MDRKSPSISATECNNGSIKIGNDKNHWMVLEKNNVKRWYLLGKYKIYKTLNLLHEIFKVIVNDKNIYIFDNDILILQIKNYKNIFIGKNTKKYAIKNVDKLYSGSSILVEIKKNEYIFINYEIFSFKTVEPIINYYSLLGRNNSFFCFATTENYAYLIKEKVYSKYDVSLGNPLDIYYNSKQKKIFNKFESCSIET